MRSCHNVRFSGSLLLGAALLMGGCAAPAPDAGQIDSAVQQTVAAPPSAAEIPPAPGGYQLTADEQKLDCPKLTGQMRVRIANMRAAAGRTNSSALGQTMQAVATPVFGGTARGADPAGDLQRDRAKLDAFGKRLAEKKCRTLDLDAELRGEAPVAPPPKGKAPKG